MTALPVDHVPGTPADSGRAHGRILAGLGFFDDAFLDAYLKRFVITNRVEYPDLFEQADRWLGGLPANYQEEIEGIATGARVSVRTAATFLYADIARPTVAEPRTFDAIRDTEPEPGAHELPSGPMCSAMIAAIDREPWVARNCDWLYATLMRGTAAVVHETPNRIPVMAVGIRGDIDVDTGINAERLWLHLHTLLDLGDPPRDRTIISWLFWAREALELCASLDELERFIERTGRDRGVIAVAADGKTGEAAVFECTKCAHTRHDFDPVKPPMVATNHPQTKPIDAAREAKARPGSTVGRFCALRSIARDHPPEHGPDDLIDVLADDGVEMRTPEHLRTIYSAVVRPETGEVWFAAGGNKGEPAASTGHWERVGWRFR
ncbi:MAG: C45 family autoproteolytic acyltransferase/hydrolase [Planctomycetota bacterium]